MNTKFPHLLLTVVASVCIASAPHSVASEAQGESDVAPDDRRPDFLHSPDHALSLVSGAISKLEERLRFLAKEESWNDKSIKHLEQIRRELLGMKGYFERQLQYADTDPAFAKQFPTELAKMKAMHRLLVESSNEKTGSSITQENANEVVKSLTAIANKLSSISAQSGRATNK